MERCCGIFNAPSAQITARVYPRIFFFKLNCINLWFSWNSPTWSYDTCPVVSSPKKCTSIYDLPNDRTRAGHAAKVLIFASTISPWDKRFLDALISSGVGSLRTTKAHDRLAGGQGKCSAVRLRFRTLYRPNCSTGIVCSILFEDDDPTTFFSGI